MRANGMGLLTRKNAGQGPSLFFFFFLPISFKLEASVGRWVGAEREREREVAQLIKSKHKKVIY